ncbi:MAG: M28 family peptidase [candidate division Zixibacteria bacterium]|nr:M28 family peptidase [candidate division Zixibacteria bacterium]
MRIPLSFLILAFIAGISCSSGSQPAFDGQVAYAYLLEQCNLGPRNPGSSGHQKGLELIAGKLRKLSPQVKVQEFTGKNALTGDSVKLYNVTVSFHPLQPNRVLLCTHWDTRPYADKDPDSSSRSTPILGANDGASGTAILLHLAEIISRTQPKFGVDMVFFDGEDMGKSGETETYALGSQHFANNLSGYRPEYAILLDMVGDRDLKIYQEEYSKWYAAETVELLWSRAEKLKLDCFVDSVGYTLWDDHLPLIQKGIQCADIIDFDYPYWHTLNDTPDKCSAQSLEKVGRLLISILYD